MPKRRPKSDERARRNHDQRDGPQLMNMGEEIDQPLVLDERLKSPFGKQAQRKCQKPANDAEYRGSVRKDAGSQAKKRPRQDEPIETLADDPEKRQVPNQSPDDRPRKSKNILFHGRSIVICPTRLRPEDCFVKTEATSLSTQLT